MIQACHLLFRPKNVNIAPVYLYIPYQKWKKHDNSPWIVRTRRTVLQKLIKWIIWQITFSVKGAILKSLSSSSTKDKKVRTFYVTAVLRL